MWGKHYPVGGYQQKRVKMEVIQQLQAHKSSFRWCNPAEATIKPVQGKLILKMRGAGIPEKYIHLDKSTDGQRRLKTCSLSPTERCLKWLQRDWVVLEAETVLVPGCKHKHVHVEPGGDCSLGCGSSLLCSLEFLLLLPAVSTNCHCVFPSVPPIPVAGSDAPRSWRDKNQETDLTDRSL